MIFEFDLQKGSNRLLGVIAEEIVATVAREKLRMYIIRPVRLLGMLNEIPKTQEIQFILRYQSTFDFFALWPDLSSEIGTEFVRDYFRKKGSLDRYLVPQEGEEIVKSFFLEVKATREGKCRPSFSDNQQQAMKAMKSGKLPFSMILAMVSLTQDHKFSVEFKNPNDESFKIEDFLH